MPHQSANEVIRQYQTASKKHARNWKVEDRPRSTMGYSTVQKIASRSLDVLGMVPDVDKFLQELAPKKDIDQLFFEDMLELLAASLREDLAQCLSSDQLVLFENFHLCFLPIGLTNACCVNTDVQGNKLEYYIGFLNEGLYFSLRQLFTALLFEELQGELAEHQRDGTQAFQAAMELYLHPTTDKIQPMTEFVGDVDASGEVGAHITSASSLLMQFVSLHEFAHAWLGHHDLIDAQQLSMAGKLDSSTSAEIGTVSHALEFAADEFAFRALMHRTKSIESQWSHCFAIYLFFSYLHVLEKKISRPISLLHPPPLKRAKRLTEILKQSFPEYAHKEIVLARIDELVAKWSA